MLEMIMRFLEYTGIKGDTFGRLTVNDPYLMEKLRSGHTLTEEAEMRIVNFMQSYEDAKS